MRIKVTKTTVYPFDELLEEAKEKAVQGLWDINLQLEWWESTFEDAANVGIKITEFELDRGSYCHGVIDDVVITAKKILKEHGDTCETYQTAKNYLNEIQQDSDGDLDNEFRLSILEDYRIILQKEYEYLGSEDAIIETIKANEYEFTEDGKLG